MWRTEHSGSHNSGSDLHNPKKKQSSNSDADNADIRAEDRINRSGLELQCGAVPREEMIFKENVPKFIINSVEYH